ncbi:MULTISPECIES: hypothetical protein [Pseudomonas]|jgi:hypothetical protein|uniref:Uncharacterized protein n=2 Tax=Pseudomonas TaxID=286 RepID=A0ABD7BIX3_PSEPU|nr:MULTISPECIES: hypothetical protein [Pseudomonas]ERT18525.1 hypothetical protein O162_11240 [Pseudomonas putida SJ3]MBH3451726.1 hypothetical protein [Pseudomonas putida]MBP2084665.1 hypothetical protein [Pseudomonas sp. PvP089]MBP2089634.1 hypothetical protein [Pseudomonas sp. PvP088]MBP2224203.1 hypothetical protein [Pseudomonas putida]
MKVTNIGLSSVVIEFASVDASKFINLSQAQREVPFKWVDAGDPQQVAIEVNIRDFSVYESLQLASDEHKLELAGAFEKYRLDEKKLADEFYVTGAIINAATRGMENNELFFVAFNALSIMPVNNHFYGALITLISYKYLEAPEYRGWVIGVLLESKTKFDDAVEYCTPNTARWGISSATAFALVLLLNDRVEDAEWVIDSALRRYEPNLNQLSYWNYCQCLILKAAILAFVGRNKESGWKFLAAFDFSRKAINDTFHSRNDWVLGQISDCHALLNLGELAMKCAAKSLGRIPSESRYADIKYSGKISFAPVFSRFQSSRSKFKSEFFDVTEMALNS